jgi:hypothetical protein
LPLATLADYVLRGMFTEGAGMKPKLILIATVVALTTGAANLHADERSLS